MSFCEGTNYFSEKYFKRIRKDKEKFRTSGDQDKQRTERTPHKCFRCGYEYYLISKCPKPSKDNEKGKK